MLTVDEFECFAGQVRAEFGLDLPPLDSLDASNSVSLAPDFELEFLPDDEPDVLAKFSGSFDGLALGAYLFDSGELLLCLNRLGTTDILCWSSLSGTSSVGQGTTLSPQLRYLFRCLVRAGHTGQHRATTIPPPL